MFIYDLLLQSTAPTTEGSPSYMNMLIPIALVFVFYFFLIRPQMRRQKEQKKFISQIKKGDHIVTLGGIHGKVVSLDGSTLSVEIAKNTHVTVEKASISLDASKRGTQRVS